MTIYKEWKKEEILEKTPEEMMDNAIAFAKAKEADGEPIGPTDEPGDTDNEREPEEGDEERDELIKDQHD